MSEKKYLTDTNKPISELNLDKYYLVIGTEANATYAYKEDKITFTSKRAKHQYLTGPNADWGHAFFYVVENDEVYTFFSFGPSGVKKIDDSKEGEIVNKKNNKKNKFIGNSSTCQYWIGEVAQLYVLNITSNEAIKIKNEVLKMYKKTNNEYYNFETKEWETKESNDKKYRALTNETCAKEAYKILNKVLGERIPEAKGYVKVYDISKRAICPFAWNENLSKSKLNHFIYPEYPTVGKAKELLAAYKVDESEINYTYFLRTNAANDKIVNSNNIMFPEFNEADTKEWMLTEGDEDPLKIYSYFSE